MKLVHSITKQEMKVGDKPTVITECAMKGKHITVQNLYPPDEIHPEGRVIYNMHAGIVPSWQQLSPVVFGYEWVEE